MGVKGLLEVLKPITSRQHLIAFRGTILAIDASAWLHWAATSCATELALGFPAQVYIEALKSRLIRVLECGVIPVFVFDGAPLPSKGVTTAKRSETAHNVALKGFNYLLEATRCIEENKLKEQQALLSVNQLNNSKDVHHLDPTLSINTGTSGDLAAQLATAQVSIVTQNKQQQHQQQEPINAWNNLDRLSNFRSNHHYGPNSAYSTGNPDLYLSLAIEKFKQVANRSTFQTIALQSLLTSFNVMWIQAPYEADAQMGYLYQKGLVQGVMGEDSDYFLFGCGLVLLKFDQQSMVDVIDLRVGALQNIVDSYEQAKYKYNAFSDEVKLLQYANDHTLMEQLKEKLQNDPFLSLNFSSQISLISQDSNSRPNNNLGTINREKSYMELFALQRDIHSLDYDGDYGQFDTFPHTLLHHLNDGPTLFPLKRQIAPNLTLSQSNFDDLYEFYEYYNKKEEVENDLVSKNISRSPITHYFDPDFTQSVLISSTIGDYNTVFLHDDVCSHRNGNIYINSTKQSQLVNVVEKSLGKQSFMQRFINRHYKPSTKSLTQLRNTAQKVAKVKASVQKGRKGNSNANNNNMMVSLGYYPHYDDGDDDDHGENIPMISTQFFQKDITQTPKQTKNVNNSVKKSTKKTPKANIYDVLSSQEFNLDHRATAKKTSISPFKTKIRIGNNEFTSSQSSSSFSSSDDDLSRRGKADNNRTPSKGIDAFSFMQYKRDEKSSLKKAKALEKELILQEKLEIKAEKEFEKAKKEKKKQLKMEECEMKKEEREIKGKTTTPKKTNNTTSKHQDDLDESTLFSDDSHGEDVMNSGSDEDDVEGDSDMADFLVDDDEDDDDLFDDEEEDYSSSSSSSTTSSSSDSDWEKNHKRLTPSKLNQKVQLKSSSSPASKYKNKILSTISLENDTSPSTSSTSICKSLGKTMTPTTKQLISTNNPSPATKRKADWILGDESDDGNAFSSMSGLDVIKKTTKSPKKSLVKIGQQSPQSTPFGKTLSPRTTHNPRKPIVYKNDLVDDNDENDDVFDDLIITVPQRQQGYSPSKMQKGNNSVSVITTPPTKCLWSSKRTTRTFIDGGINGTMKKDDDEMVPLSLGDGVDVSVKKKELFTNLFGKATSPSNKNTALAPVDSFNLSQPDPFATQIADDYSSSLSSTSAMIITTIPPPSTTVPRLVKRSSFRQSLSTVHDFPFIDTLPQLPDDLEKDQSLLGIFDVEDKKITINNSTIPLKADPQTLTIPSTTFTFSANSLNISPNMISSKFGSLNGKGVYRPSIGALIIPCFPQQPSQLPISLHQQSFSTPNQQYMETINESVFVMLSDQDYVDQRFKKLEFLNSLHTPSSSQTSSQAPLPTLLSPQITNNLTTSLQLSRLNALITPHEHSLRKYISSHPFLFLGPRSHITSSLPQSLISDHASHPSDSQSVVKTSPTGNTVKDAAQWGCLMKLISLSHFQFVEVCILAGCDYLPSLSGIGFKKALNLYSLTGSAHNVIDVYYQQCLAILKRGEKKTAKEKVNTVKQPNTKKDPKGQKVRKTSSFNHGYAKDDDEFGAGLYDEEEWTDDDDDYNNLEDDDVDEEEGKMTKKQSTSNSPSKPTTKKLQIVRPWSNEADLTRYFTQYHENYDYALLSYLYQYVIDPVRERFTHVFNLLDMQSLIPSTLATTNPVSTRNHTKSQNNQMLPSNGHQHGSFFNSAIGGPHLPCREQQSLIPILSFISTQTSSTDDLVSLWSYLKTKRIKVSLHNFLKQKNLPLIVQKKPNEVNDIDGFMGDCEYTDLDMGEFDNHVITAKIQTQSNDVPGSLSKQLQDYLLHHADREYVNFAPKIPYFVLQPNITTAVPIILNYEPIHLKTEGEGIGMRKFQPTTPHKNHHSSSNHSIADSSTVQPSYTTNYTPLIDPREQISRYYSHQLDQTALSLITIQPHNPQNNQGSDDDGITYPILMENKDKYYRHLMGQYYYWILNNKSPVPQWKVKSRPPKASNEKKDDDKTDVEDDLAPLGLDGDDAADEEKKKKEELMKSKQPQTGTKRPTEPEITRENLISYLNRYVNQPENHKNADADFSHNAEMEIEQISKINKNFQNFQRKLLHFLTVQQRSNIIPKDLLFHSFHLMDCIEDDGIVDDDHVHTVTSTNSTSTTPSKSPAYQRTSLPKATQLDQIILRDQIQAKINLYTEKMSCIGYTLPHNLARGILFGELDPYWLTYTNAKFAFPQNNHPIIAKYSNGNKVVFNYPYLGPNFGLYCTLSQSEKDDLLSSKNLFNWGNIINSMLTSFSSRNNTIHKILGLAIKTTGGSYGPNRASNHTLQIPHHLTISHFSNNQNNQNNLSSHVMSSVSQRLHFHLLKLFDQISAPLPFSLDTPIKFTSDKLNIYQSLNSLSNLQSLWSHQGGYVKSLYQHITRSTLRLPATHHHDIVKSVLPLTGNNGQAQLTQNSQEQVEHSRNTNSYYNELGWISSPIPFHHRYKQTSDTASFNQTGNTNHQGLITPMTFATPKKLSSFDSSKSTSTASSCLNSHHHSTEFAFPDDLIEWFDGMDRDIVVKSAIISYSNDLEALNQYYQVLKDTLYHIESLDNLASFNANDEDDIEAKVGAMREGVSEIYKICIERIKEVRAKTSSSATPQRLSSPYHHKNSPLTPYSNSKSRSLDLVLDLMDKTPVSGQSQTARVKKYQDELIVQHAKSMPSCSLPSHAKGYDEVVRLDQYITKETISYLAFNFLIGSIVNPVLSHDEQSSNTHGYQPSQQLQESQRSQQHFLQSTSTTTNIIESYEDVLNKLATTIGFGLEQHPHLLALLNVLRFTLPITSPNSNHPSHQNPITLSVFGLYASMCMSRLPLETKGVLYLQPSFEKQMMLATKQTLLQSSLDSDTALLNAITDPTNPNPPLIGLAAIQKADELRANLLTKRKAVAILKQQVTSKDNLHTYTLSPDACILSHRENYSQIQQHNGVQPGHIKQDNSVTIALTERYNDFIAFQKANPTLNTTSLISLPLTSLLLHHETATPPEIVSGMNEQGVAHNLITSPHILSGDGSGNFFCNTILRTHPSHIQDKKSQFHPRSDCNTVTLGVSPIFLLFMLSSIYHQAIVSSDLPSTIPANLQPITSLSNPSVNGMATGNSSFGSTNGSRGLNNNTTLSPIITHNTNSIIPFQSVLQLLFPLIPIYTYSSGLNGGMSAIFHKATTHQQKMTTMVKEMTTAHINTLVHRMKLFQAAFTIASIAMSRDYWLSQSCENNDIQNVMGDDDQHEVTKRLLIHYNVPVSQRKVDPENKNITLSLFGPDEMSHFDPAEPLSINHILLNITNNNRPVRKVIENNGFVSLGSKSFDSNTNLYHNTQHHHAPFSQTIPIDSSFHHTSDDQSFESSMATLESGDFQLDENGHIVTSTDLSLYQTNPLVTNTAESNNSKPALMNFHNKMDKNQDVIKPINPLLNKHTNQNTQQVDDLDLDFDGNNDVDGRVALGEMFADLLDDIDALKQMDYRSFLMEQDEKNREAETRQMRQEQIKLAKKLTKEQSKADKREAKKEEKKKMGQVAHPTGLKKLGNFDPNDPFPPALSPLKTLDNIKQWKLTTPPAKSPHPSKSLFRQPTPPVLHNHHHNNLTSITSTTPTKSLNRKTTADPLGLGRTESLKRTPSKSEHNDIEIDLLLSQLDKDQRGTKSSKLLLKEIEERETELIRTKYHQFNYSDDEWDLPTLPKTIPSTSNNTQAPSTPTSTIPTSPSTSNPFRSSKITVLTQGGRHGEREVLDIDAVVPPKKSSASLLSALKSSTSTQNYNNNNNNNNHHTTSNHNTTNQNNAFALAKSTPSQRNKSSTQLPQPPQSPQFTYNAFAMLSNASKKGSGGCGGSGPNQRDREVMTNANRTTVIQNLATTFQDKTLSNAQIRYATKQREKGNPFYGGTNFPKRKKDESDSD